jgi:molybdopterin converting factor small subunit
MQVTVEYAAQIKRAAGVARDVIELDGPCQLAEIARAVAIIHGDSFAEILLDENRQPRPSILVFMGEEQVRWDDTNLEVEDGQTITLLSPVSGG